MPCTVGTRHYIDGGGLQHSWYPHDVCRVGEDIFVALHNNEYKLKTFFRSKDLSVCPIDAGFLQHLRELRNVAVDRILLEHFRKDDPLCTELPHAARSLVDASALPRVVQLTFPAMVVEGLEVPERAVEVICDLVPNAVTKVKLDGDMLETLRAAAISLALSGVGPGKRNRRAKRDRVRTGYDFIFPDYRREQLWATYRDGDGVERRLSERADLSSEDDLARACAQLWEQLKVVHHAAMDGKFVGAFQHKLDIFREES